MEDLDILKSSELLNEVLVSHLDLGYKSKDVKNVFHQTYSEIPIGIVNLNGQKVFLINFR